MKIHSECFYVLTDVERFKKDLTKAMDLLFMDQIRSFLYPNDIWVRSAATKWMKNNKFCFLPINRRLDERTKKRICFELFFGQIYSSRAKQAQAIVSEQAKLIHIR